MTHSGKVTVLLANWNGARFLSESIESVVRQTFTDWRMVVVDTGSDDDSRSILGCWAASESRIGLWLIPQRLSCPAALNIGLAEARGEFVARIESDDLWHPERLERQLAFMCGSGRERVGVCGSDVVLIGESGRVLATKHYPRTDGECRGAIWYRNPFCHSSTLLRRVVFETCGGYRERDAPAEDLALWFRVGRRWEFRNVPEALVAYRVWPGSLTSRRLRSLVWRSYTVRREAVRQMGYRRSRLAAAYSTASLGAALLPARVARPLFQWFLSGFANPHSPFHPDPISLLHGQGRNVSQGARPA
jgi:glycosyltransferase involved in cell wall biosynthesis